MKEAVYVDIGQEASGYTHNLFFGKVFTGTIQAISVDGKYAIIENKWGTKKMFHISDVFLNEMERK